jgi:membrane-bound ClpP family serine protease
MDESQSFLVKNPIVSAVIAVVGFFGGFILRGVTGGTLGFILLCLGMLVAVIAGQAAWRGYKQRRAAG